MEELVTKFKPKTDNYDANIGDDISAAAKTLMDDIITTLKSFRKEVSEKTSGVRNFAKKWHKNRQFVSAFFRWF